MKIATSAHYSRGNIAGQAKELKELEKSRSRCDLGCGVIFLRLDQCDGISGSCDRNSNDRFGYRQHLQSNADASGHVCCGSGRAV